MAKKVLIFGSTGSIGKSALDVVRTSNGRFSVLGLCANNDIQALAAQVREFKPKFVCISNEARFSEAKKLMPRTVKLLAGSDGMDIFSSLKADISVMAISGISCLKPLFKTIENVSRVALANKEAIVAAGNLVFNKAKKFNTQIIPVDSEINSLFQLLDNAKDVDRLYVTASGGALLDYTPQQLARVTAAQVLAHPTWRMGKRITVDSATLVNKAFELIETHRFFNIPYSDIGAVIHRQSYVHAMLQKKDGTVFMCVYPPDMKMPIRHSLYYPGCIEDKKPLRFDNKLMFSFEPLISGRFSAFDVVMEAAKLDGNMPAIVNACDEVAVEAFLAGKIHFMDIAKILSYVFEHSQCKKINAIEDVYKWDLWAREKTQEYLIRRF